MTVERGDGEGRGSGGSEVTVERGDGEGRGSDASNVTRKGMIVRVGEVLYQHSHYVYVKKRDV